MAKKRAIRVVVHNTHYDVVAPNGQTYVSSETFHDKHGAARAAKAFIEAINTREMVLETWKSRGRFWDRVVTVVRRPWAHGHGTVALPAELGMIPVERSSARFLDAEPQPGQN